jgi:predicted dienelactone hydrolase
MPGFRFIEVPADTDGPACEGAMWYPCSEPPREIDLGTIAAMFGIMVSGAKDCPVDGDKLPLVVVSHGRGGHFVSHHDTIETLADAGFVVAAINHPGDTYFDMSRSGDLSAYVDRPTDIRRLIDYMLSVSPAAPNIDRQRIGFYGFSRGGYTGLVLIGGNPDWASATEFCLRSSAPLWCERIRRKEFPVQALAHDSRIKAAVIADPLAVFFTGDSLAPVKVPVQLWASELGGDGVTDRQVAAVDRYLPAEHEYHIVPNSGHFAFLAPCPPALVEAIPEICTDAPGFDRAAFHEQFNAAVLAFFRVNLGDR